MKRIIILLLISILYISKSYTQEYYELEELFLDADSWFFHEDYQEALPLFLKVLEADSLNYNVMYKIGFCYLHIDGQKAKSIPYLENAIKRTTPNYRNNNYVEDLAPVDALFYLGNAYLVNNRIDEAIDAYTGFQNAIERTKKLANKDIYDTDYLVRQFDACRNALQFQYKPVNFLARNVGNKINTRFNEYNAVVSGDGSTLVFTASLQFYDAIFYSKKENGQWSYPINLMGQLGIDDNSATTGLSYDGTELYIYRDDNMDGNIYVSFLNDGIWSKVKKLGENINTKYWEAHASLSPDNNKLYFVSNREGRYDDLDIYVSERLTDTTWGEPMNLGGIINTQWNENSPFLTPDGKRLFFSSEGHKGMGGYDIYYSDLEDGKWTEPVNVGYPINTTDNDIFFVPFENGNFAYCSQFSKKGYGGQDIYQFHLFDLPGYNNFLVEGIVEMDNEVDRNKIDFKINIIDKENNDTLTVLKPDENSINLQLRTPLGKNHLVYESILDQKEGQQFYISSPYDIKEVFLKSIHKQESDEIALTDTLPNISLENNYYFTDNQKNIKIKLSLEKGNKLLVDTYYKGKLINSEEFEITKNDFVYEYKPLLGESKIKFKLVDKNNNVKAEEVTVSYLPKDTQAELNIAEKIVVLNPDGSKNVKIKLSVEKKSKLFVETFVDDKLINTETFNIRKESFVYEFEPEGNKTKLHFRLVDKHNNIKTEEIIISHAPIKKELADVLNGVNTFNNKGLQTILSSPEIQNATSNEELINKLYSQASSLGLSQEEVQILIVALAANLTDNTPEFITGLLDIAEGGLKTALESINANKGDYSSNMDVINELRLKSKTHNYTNDDIVALLEEYIKQSNIPVKELIAIIQGILKINIPGILTNIDASAIDITNLEELKQYLTEKGTYSENELNQIFDLLDAILLVKSSDKIDIELAKILEDSKSFEKTKLQNIISSPELTKTSTSEELINEIYAKAEAEGLSQEEIQALIIALAINFTNNTPEFINGLFDIAEGGLKAVLKSIKSNSKDYNSNLDVIKELRIKSKTHDYTVNDIIELLEKYIKQSDIPVSGLIAIMQQILESDIAGIISDIDTSELNITSIKQLKEYLVKQNIYSQEQLDQILSFIEALSLINAKDDSATKIDQQDEKKKGNWMVPIALICFIGFILIIIFFNRRKNKANKKSVEN